MGCGGLVSTPDCRQKPTYKESRANLLAVISKARYELINSYTERSEGYIMPCRLGEGGQETYPMTSIYTGKYAHIWLYIP